MAQPSGQLLVDAGNPLAGLFFYAQGTNGIWDANNGALLAKTGTAGMAVEGGANVVLGNAATHYSLAAAQTLTAPFTLRVKARKEVGTTTNSMTCGNDAATNCFHWLDSSAGKSKFRIKTGVSTYGDIETTAAISTTAHSVITLTMTAAREWVIYQDDAVVGSGAMGAGAAEFFLSAICGGYSGGSFRLNGALEFLHAIPGYIASPGEIAALNADPYAVLDVGGSNAQPTFPGPNIGNQIGIVGVALSVNDVSSKFSDTDALTFSAIGTWPPGVTVSSAGVISGTPVTAGVYSGLAVRATDTASQPIDSDTFSFTISAASHLITASNSQQVNTAGAASVQQSGFGTITLPALRDWGTGNLKPNETGVRIIVNNEASGALATMLTNQTADASAVLPMISGLVSGTEYRITTILADGSEGTWVYTAS